MSRLLSAQPDPSSVAAFLSRDVVGAVLALEMQFASGTVRISNSLGRFIDAAGTEWAGLGDMVGMTDFAGGDTLAPLREYTLGIPWEFLAEDTSSPAAGLARVPALIGDPSEYRGRAAILSMHLFEADALGLDGRSSPVGIPIVLDTGTMTNVGWSWSPGEVMLTLKVEGLLSRKGAPLFGLLTERDHKRRHPTDQFLDFASEVVVTEVKWTQW